MSAWPKSSHRTARRSAAAGAIAAVFAAAAFSAAQGQIFRTREPELVFEAETTALDPGVHVVRDAEEYAALAGGLAPPPAEPDLAEATLLLVVGADRADDCRRTFVDEVTTRFRTATVTMAEHEPGPACRCAPRGPTRSVFGVLVAGFVKKARLEVVPVVLDCGAPGVPAAAPVTPAVHDAPAPPPRAAPVPPGLPSGPVEEILSGTLVDGEPGARVLSDAETWHAFCETMNQADSCEPVDFARSRVVVVVGRPLENSCRATKNDGVAIEGTTARVALREVHPSPARACAQIFGGYQVFAFRVPAVVETVTIDSRKVQ